jgi:hypothetical protein
MKTPNEPTDPTPEAAPAKKAGRPPKHGAPMAAKYRAAAYRNRRREAALTAHENLKDASPAVLLAGLVRQFKALAKNDPDHAPVSRWLAGELIIELCERYKIELPRSPGAFDQDKKGGAGQW